MPSHHYRPCIIIFLLAAVGVLKTTTDAFYISPTASNDTVLQPILTRTRIRRICAELCLEGLGGDVCGADCVDIAPQGLPMTVAQSSSSALGSNGSSLTSSYGSETRHQACEILCANGLGYPLCGCQSNDKDTSTSTADTDFFAVCSVFCVKYNYQIFGCQTCALYKNFEESLKNATTETANSSTNGVGSRALTNSSPPAVVNWNLWCKSKCAKGDGGVACSCDLLPMSLTV